MTARKAEHEAAIAATRFGLGARPGEIGAIGADARGWLRQQVKTDASFDLSAPGLLTTRQAVEALGEYREARPKKGEAGVKPSPMAKTEAAQKEEAVVGKLKDLARIAAAEVAARANRGLATGDGFAERLVCFWSNHFTVAAVKGATIPLVGVYEREVIRANMTGSFYELLLAAMRHPGMLLYLDQAQSIGPNSRAGERRGAGLNENLAREAMELMTVGASAGYLQDDVTEFARALTGWTFVAPRIKRLAPGAEVGDFVFLERLHEPGARVVMGKRYPEGGEEQARAILKDLARHKATARRVATQLAAHFTADTPPESAVERLEQVFLDTDGDLPSLHAALIELPEAWSAEKSKFKTPNDFILSSLRMIGAPSVEEKAILAAYGLLGQTPYRAPSPEGWPDDAASWAGPDAVMKRLEWSQALAARLGGRARPEALGAGALGPLLSAETVEAARRAESAEQGLALVLMSPDFQRR